MTTNVEPDSIPLIPVKYCKLISAGTVLLALIDMFSSYKVSVSALALIGLSLVPWFYPVLKSFKLPGGVEFTLRDEIRQIRKQVTDLTDSLRMLEESYLNVCDEINNETNAKDMDELGTDMKSLSGALVNLDFLIEYITNPRVEFQGRAYGAACAIQVRPQEIFLVPLIDFLSEYSREGSGSEVRKFRLKVIFRVLMALESIIRMDARRANGNIGSDMKGSIIDVLNRLSTTNDCLDDAKKYPRSNIIVRIDRINKFISTIDVEKKREHASVVAKPHSETTAVSRIK